MHIAAVAKTLIALGGISDKRKNNTSDGNLRFNCFGSSCVQPSLSLVPLPAPDFDIRYRETCDGKRNSKKLREKAIPCDKQ
jgi:hypothetical protein